MKTFSYCIKHFTSLTKATHLCLSNEGGVVFHCLVFPNVIPLFEQVFQTFNQVIDLSMSQVRLSLFKARSNFQTNWFRIHFEILAKNQAIFKMIDGNHVRYLPFVKSLDWCCYLWLIRHLMTLHPSIFIIYNSVLPVMVVEHDENIQKQFEIASYVRSFSQYISLQNSSFSSSVKKVYNSFEG